MVKNWKQYEDLEYYPDRVCACGCGGKIKVRSYHKIYGIPKVINGHRRRGMVHGDPNCLCCICRAKKGGYIGSGNPLYGTKVSRELVERRLEARRNNGKPWHSEAAKEKYSITKMGKRNPMYGLTGEKSSSWQGGLSVQGYPFNFDDELKSCIRERDKVCQLCSKTREENARELDVHHIDYVKENLDPKNLIALCRRCNGKVNTKRDFWKEFFNAG